MSTIRAREYRRLSKDRGGSSIEEQAQDNAQAAAENGWELGEAYVDADRSASEYKAKEREGFDQLIADLRADRFNAQVLILWESSRGSRDVGEWDALIKICRRRRVQIHVTSHRRTYDPENYRDRRTLHEDALDSAYESDKNAARIRRTTASQAAKGRPHGLAPYGFKPVYDTKKAKLDTWVENPDESFVPKELFRLLEAGHTLAGIERTFTDRDWVNLKTGRPFTRHHLRNMATRQAYAGIRVHTDPVTGQTTETPGTWDAIVPPERFYNVRRILARNPRNARNGMARYELTMTLRCDTCGGPLTVTRANLKSHRESYTCRDSHVFIAKADVDAIVIPALMAYLARPDIYKLLAAPKDDDERVAKVRERLAQDRAALAEMEKETPESAHHARVLARSIEALAGKITALEDEERELTMPTALVGLLGGSEDVSGWWSGAPLSARREVARIVLSPGLLGEVRVKPTPVKGRTPDVAERLRWRRAS
jgi:DNA invertase Pin-like site-specific DNA recombinase